MNLTHPRNLVVAAFGVLTILLPLLTNVSQDITNVFIGVALILLAV